MEVIQPISQPVQTPSKNTYKILFIVTLGLFLVVSSVLITLLLNPNKGQLKLTTKDQETKIIPTQSIESQNDSNVTSPETTSSIPNDWKTYSYRNIYANKKIHFSFNYPSNWIVKVSEFGAMVSNLEYVKGYFDPFDNSVSLGENILISFYENYKTSLTDGKTLESYISDNSSFPSFSKTKLNNLDGYQVVENGMGGEYPGLYIISGDDLYVISSDVGDFSETEKQILSTLKFN